MTLKTAGRLFIAGALALAVPIVAQEFGGWFPALAFLGWAGFLMWVAAALIVASHGLEGRQ